VSLLAKSNVIPKNNDVHHMSEDILSSLDAQVETAACISVDCEDQCRHFPVHSESYIIYLCLFLSTEEYQCHCTHTHHNRSYYFLCWRCLELAGGMLFMFYFIYLFIYLLSSLYRRLCPPNTRKMQVLVTSILLPSWRREFNQL
jgi:hypothetical protein